MKLNIFSAIATILLASTSINAELSSKNKQDLLQLHRSARDALNAPDMKSISWDDSLASAAQEYSTKCKGMEHSHEGPENLAGSTTGNIIRMFNNWIEEKDLFDESGYRSKFLGGKYHGKKIGHYSQIVWAKNDKVGCGFTYCENYSAKYLLVCKYATGNIKNQQVYALSSDSNSDHKNDSDQKKNDVDHHHEEKTTQAITTQKITTTTQNITTTTPKITSTTQKTTTIEQNKATPEPKPSSQENKDESTRSVPTNNVEKQNPTVNSNVVLGNNTFTNDDDKKTEDLIQVETDDGTVETDDGVIVKPDGTVETENINENYEKDGIIDEVGPSVTFSDTATSGSIGLHKNSNLMKIINTLLMINVVFVFFI